MAKSTICKSSFSADENCVDFAVVVETKAVGPDREFEASCCG